VSEELAELLLEINGEVKVCNHSWRKGSVNGIRMFLCYIYSWRKGSANGISVFMFVLIREGKEVSANGVHVQMYVW